MQTKEQKGSALVFSLVVLSMILVAALGVASVSVVEKKNSSATGKSTQAFQVADSAVEVVLKHAVLDPAGTTLQELAGEFGGSCTSGVISGTISGGTVEITLSDDGTPPANLGCNDNLSQATTVKSVGRSGDTTRAINSAVAAGTLSWIEPSLLNGWNNFISNGNQIYGDDVAYSKDSRTGIVYLKGMILHGTDFKGAGVNCVPAGTCSNVSSPSTLFTLPSTGGYRPAAQRVFAVPCGNAAGVAGSEGSTTYSANVCRVDVEVDGDVRFQYPQAVWISLNGISFSTN